jgi:hypothetical protein
MFASKVSLVGPRYFKDCALPRFLPRYPTCPFPFHGAAVHIYGKDERQQWQAKGLPMTNNTIPLKPCPFCGGEAMFNEDTPFIFVKCSNDECTLHFSQFNKEDWNTRPQPTEAQIEAAATAMLQFEVNSEITLDDPDIHKQIWLDQAKAALIAASEV